MKLRVKIHPAGAALLALAFVFADSHAALAAAAALLWHEGAHLMAMALCGVTSCLVELTPFGGMAHARDYEKLSPIRQAIIAASGILASGLGVWLCLRVLPNTLFVYALLQTNLSLLVVNCLPAWPLDGARVLTALMRRFGWEHACRRAFMVFGYTLGACMVALGLYGAWHGTVNWGLLALGPYLWYAARWGDRSQRIRSMGREPFSEGELLPVLAYACPEGSQRQAMARISGAGLEGRYGVLLAIDSRQGGITEVITQHQMKNRLFVTGMEDIGAPANMDKAAGI